MMRSSIVLLLAERPLHGYGIMKEVEKRIGRSVNPSLLYPFLKQLESNGLVNSRRKSVGKKQKKIYELTTRGEALSSRIYKRVASIVSTAIEPNLSVCFHCGCRIYEGGHRENVDDKERTFCCVHCAFAFKHETTLASHLSEKPGKPGRKGTK